MAVKEIQQKIACDHCGEDCDNRLIRLQDKTFCCEGCKMVYSILNQNGLCDYYQLNEQPGINQRSRAREGKFAYLDDEKIEAQLVSFRDGTQTHIRFYLPQIHCSSCLYLLENLRRLNQGILSAKVDFPAKEVAVIFDSKKISLRQTAELLAEIGYEPYIALHHLGKEQPGTDRKMIYQLGIAGFCFGNIMLLSFPEYLGLGQPDKNLQVFFRGLVLLLSLPSVFYSAQPFYQSAWKGLSKKFLPIDAPIALAILITFTRSLYEVFSGHSAGFFDSMTGIIFFMLAGRVLQDRTQRRLSFERDYTSYFPVAVSVLRENKEIPTALPDIRAGDTLLIHHEELIPADGILSRGRAWIDYSFVTGESLPVLKETGDIVYAGGRQTGENIEILVVKEVVQSYLTQLWNKQADKQALPEKNGGTLSQSFIHGLSRYFTYVVLAIAIASAIYWQLHDPSRVWPVVTAVMIVACPCALLLSGTFTNSNILRILDRNHFYLRNAQTIEEIAGSTDIVFDKTGTLTNPAAQNIAYEGCPLSPELAEAIRLLAAQSTHPLSKALAKNLAGNDVYLPNLTGFSETPGMGIEGWIDGSFFRLGSILLCPCRVSR